MIHPSRRPRLRPSTVVSQLSEQEYIRKVRQLTADAPAKPWIRDVDDVVVLMWTFKPQTVAYDGLGNQSSLFYSMQNSSRSSEPERRTTKLSTNSKRVYETVITSSPPTTHTGQTQDDPIIQNIHNGNSNSANKDHVHHSSYDATATARTRGAVHKDTSAIPVVVSFTPPHPQHCPVAEYTPPPQITRRTTNTAAARGRGGARTAARVSKPPVRHVEVIVVDDTSLESRSSADGVPGGTPETLAAPWGKNLATLPAPKRSVSRTNAVDRTNNTNSSKDDEDHATSTTAPPRKRGRPSSTYVTITTSPDTVSSTAQSRSLEIFSSAEDATDGRPGSASGKRLRTSTTARRNASHTRTPTTMDKFLYCQ